eukprot:2610506-Rhodomonas_salina.2
MKTGFTGALVAPYPNVSAGHGEVASIAKHHYASTEGGERDACHQYRAWHSGSIQGYLMTASSPNT